MNYAPFIGIILLAMIGLLLWVLLLTQRLKSAIAYNEFLTQAKEDAKILHNQTMALFANEKQKMEMANGSK